MSGELSRKSPRHRDGGTGGRWLLAIAGALACASAAQAFDLRSGPAEAPPGAPSFDAWREFGTRDGLMQSTAYALAQDRAGYVWAGTEDGVARYDGRRWQRVALLQDDSSAPPYVYSLAATDDGAMWVAADDRGLYRIAGDERTRFDAARGMNAANVHCVIAADASGVWVATSEGVARCDPQRCRLIEPTSQLDVWTLLAGPGPDLHPALWIGTLRDGVYRHDDPDGEARLAPWHLGAAEGLPANTVRALALWGGPDGRDLWIGTGFGFSRLSGDALTVYGEDLAVTPSAISALLPSVDADGQPVLLATLTRGGLLRIRDSGEWSRYSTRQGLPDEGLYSLLQTDRERGVPRLWIGTQSAGVVRREAGRWTTIDARHGLPHRAIRGIGRVRFPDGLETYWIGTVGGTARLREATWEPLPEPRLARAVVYAIAQASDGTLWMGSDEGLVRWRADGVEIYDHHRIGMPANAVIAVHARRTDAGTDEVWAGTRHGFTRVVDGRFTMPSAWPKALGPTVRVFAESRDGAGHALLWAGGEGGAEAFDGRSWTELPAECLPDREVMDLRVGGEPGAQTLWIATRGGIARARLDGALACQQLRPPRLPVATVYQIQIDARGRLYLFGYEGVLRMTPDAAAPDDLARMAIERYDENDGLPALEFNRATHVDDAGRIWAGSIAGAVVLDPGRESPAQELKPLLLERAELLPSQRRLADGGRVAASDGTLRFAYALMSYEREHLTRYRTQLVGLDNVPGEWTSDASVTYTRLPPGEYTFRVWGRDALGAVSNARSLRFDVEAPAWQRPWALAAYAGLLLLAGAGAGLWRDRALAGRAARLQREVAQRTQDLADANRQLEQAALTDPLTGLHNRRYFSARLAGDLERIAEAHAAGNTASARVVCLLDLDYFKTINDRYGHSAGDMVLARVGTCLRELATPPGCALRWGGEEFLLVLATGNGTDPENAARRVLDALRQCVHRIAGRELSVTCSLGWAAWPWSPLTPRLPNVDQVLTLVDQALYRAKGSGRNRAVGAISDETAPPLPDHPELRVRWRSP